MTLGERIQLIIKELDMNPTSFSTRLKYKNNVQIPEYIKGVKPGPDFFKALIQEIPSVNLEWLIAEIGTPFKNNQGINQEPAKNESPLEKSHRDLQRRIIENLQQMVDERDERIKLQDAEIASLKRRLGGNSGASLADN